MLKNNNLLLKIFAAAVFSLYSSAACASGTVVKASALDGLVETVSLSGRAALPAPAAVSVPEVLPVKAEARAGAPKPGKDFSPLVEDKARIQAIMKLVSAIYNGEHLPYSQDGSTFKNKEGRLPAMPVGFYKEYTLLTGNAPHVVTIGGITYKVAPDLSARGSERIIIGGGEKIYYTPDHYANFILLKVVY